MEARVYAENPANGFLPSTGPLSHVKLPGSVRVDSGVEEADTVTNYYDPMLAKLIASGSNRALAATRLADACRSVEIWPVKTNAGFLARALSHTDFMQGRVDTGFIARHPDLVPSEVPDPFLIAQAAHALLPRGKGPWETLQGLRVGMPSELRVAVWMAGKTWQTLPQTGPATVVQDGDISVLFADGHAWEFGLPRFESRGEGIAADGVLTAPMPGMVTVVEVAEGQAVKRGEVLLVLEAMKMENALAAPFDGVVAVLKARLGDQVQEGAVLARIERASP
jgi:3-methylcrotonyl-CoA carboxylase alpha subunit